MTYLPKSTLRLIAILFAASMLAGACSSSAGVDAPEAVAPSENRDLVATSGSGEAGCRLLSDAFIMNLFGEVVPPNDGLADEIDTLEESECTWRATADDDAETDHYYISLGVYPPGHLANYPAAWDKTPVAGIGDEAFVDLIGGLSFREGDDEYELFLRRSWGAEVTDEQELKVLTAAALEVLANR